MVIYPFSPLSNGTAQAAIALHLSHYASTCGRTPKPPYASTDTVAMMQKIMQKMMSTTPQLIK